MKKPNITEGEWELTDKRHNPMGWERSIDNGLDPICVVECYEGNESDAKAISAVPEMIDALIESTRTLQEIKPYTSGKTRNKINKQIEMNKYSALQKAGVTEL